MPIRIGRNGRIPFVSRRVRNGNWRGERRPLLAGGEDRRLAAAPTLPYDPDATARVRGSSRKYVGAQRFGDLHRRSWSSVLDRPRPDIEIVVLIGGPEDPDRKSTRLNSSH